MTTSDTAGYTWETGSPDDEETAKIVQGKCKDKRQ